MNNDAKTFILHKSVCGFSPSTLHPPRICSAHVHDGGAHELSKPSPLARRAAESSARVRMAHPHWMRHRAAPETVQCETANTSRPKSGGQKRSHRLWSGSVGASFLCKTFARAFQSRIDCRLVQLRDSLNSRYLCDRTHLAEKKL